jgi:hypothetical protein
VRGARYGEVIGGCVGLNRRDQRQIRQAAMTSTTMKTGSTISVW